MNWKQFAIRIITACAALAAPARLAWGQSCNCRDYYAVPGEATASRAFRPVEDTSAAKPSRRLPAGWPVQWSEPAMSANSQKVVSGTPETTGIRGIAPTQVRDPFTGQIVPTKSYSILPSKSGPAAGGAIGGVTGGGGIGGGVGGSAGALGGGMGGNSGGGGAGGGTNWSPRTANSGRGGTSSGSSDRSGSGTLGFLANSGNTSGSTSSGNSTSTANTSNTGSSGTGTTTPVVTDHGIDVPVVIKPDIPIPDYTPDIPPDGNPVPVGGPGPGPGGGNTPIVPEPGSIILLGMAGATAGVFLIRRRRNKLNAVPGA